MAMNSDIICAPATGVGQGAIAIVRLSGPGSVALTETLFSKSLHDKPSHTVHYGLFGAKNDPIDEVVVTLFGEGKSFTGEESVEIACHASLFVVQKMMQLLIQAGARSAQPGEFTQRAFLNGRMDLSQAEAVADLIAAKTAGAHSIALNQLRGNFSQELTEMREKLIHFASLVELELDFAEEDVEFADRSELLLLVEEVLSKVTRLAASFEYGNALKNGVPVALIGAPNTGKSTLLNQLLGEERAIVSNIPGTTRDVIEDTLVIEGITFRFIDTAGIREHTTDEIESLGIQRSMEKLKQAKIVLYLGDAGEAGSALEGHQSMSVQQTATWAALQQAEFPDKRFVVLANKSELVDNLSVTEWEVPVLAISAKTGKGIDELKQWLIEATQTDFNFQEDIVVSNQRHLEALLKTKSALEAAQHGLQTQVTGDFVAMDIRQAMFWLGTITGQISEDDLLANIFSKFCIGK